MYKLVRYRIRPYILMYFLRSIKHTTSRFSAVEDCVLKNARLSAVETVGCRGNQGSKPIGVHVPNVGTDRIVCGHYRPDLRSPCGDHVPTRGIRAGRAMLCPVVPRGILRRSLVVALRAHALDVLLHALLMFQASKRHSPAAGSKGHS